MFTTITSWLRSTRMNPRRLARWTSVAVVLSVAAAGMACSGSPTSPASSSERRVQTGGGGGTVLPIACEKLSCVEVVAGGGTLSGKTVVTQPSRDMSQFTFTSQMEGTGRFDNGVIAVAVDRHSVLIREIAYSKNGQVYQDTGVTAVPTIRFVDDAGCASGVVVETTFVAMFENFGRTTINERHCAVAAQ